MDISIYYIHTCLNTNTYKWEDILCSWAGKINVKCLYYPEPSIDSHQISNDIFLRNITILTFVWNHKNSQSDTEKEQS